MKRPRCRACGKHSADIGSDLCMFCKRKLRLADSRSMTNFTEDMRQAGIPVRAGVPLRTRL